MSKKLKFVSPWALLEAVESPEKMDGQACKNLWETCDPSDIEEEGIMPDLNISDGLRGLLQDITGAESQSRKRRLQMFVEMAKEVRKCESDPCYFYNKYIRGSGLKPLTQEEYDTLRERTESRRGEPCESKVSHQGRRYPLTPEEAFRATPPRALLKHPSRRATCNLCGRDQEKIIANRCDHRSCPWWGASLAQRKFLVE